VDTLLGNLSDLETSQPPCVTLPKTRIAQIPRWFTLGDITGDFTVDPQTGASIVLKAGGDSSGGYVDIKGKRVNRRGYTVDRAGNVVSNKD
jgi:hypothetical protein